MKVILPMAGRGSRFANRGYATPKPLIDVAGKPMFQWALKSLESSDIELLIVIALKEHDEQFGLNHMLKQLPYPFELVLLNEVTEGQLCTVLEGIHLVSEEEAFLVCPSDTYIRSNLQSDIQEKTSLGAKGIISVFNLPGNRWSFAKTGEDGWVELVAEKERISDQASTGIYYFYNAGLFKKMAQEIIDADDRTKGEFYVIPVYQQMIKDGYKVATIEALEMWDMGTPESKFKFEQYITQNG